MADVELERTARARLGRVLRGKYRLDRVLGTGGMAVVYAATHRNKKRFAIKMLHPELSTRETIRTRFLREGYVANSVDHPGAVAVLDDDVAEDGSAFVVMELLEGEPVDRLWARHGRRLPLGLALSIADALLDVLAAAHARGVVHRDVKPANLFLTRDGHLRVLDFGIARLHDTPGEATATGAMLGTPAFMSPEQALADPARIDGRTDVWAVGATLFTLLTGEYVHAGDNPSQLLVRSATERARPIASVQPDVPAAVARVVDRALAFDREDRWASAGEMREALAQACVEATGAPVAPLPVGAAGARGDDDAPGSGEPGSAAAVASASTATSGRGVVSDSTATSAGVAATHAAAASGRRARTLSRLGVLVVAGAVAGGGFALYRWAYAPRARYCLELDEHTAEGPRCALEVTAEATRRRAFAIARVTEVRGVVQSTELVNFAGAPFEHSRRLLHSEVRRDAAGRVTEIVKRSPFGAVVVDERWSADGKRIDQVDLDGRTPRRNDEDTTDTSQGAGGTFTSIEQELDEQGRQRRVRFLGPTGRPRTDSAGAYGYLYEYGRTPLVRTRTTALAADGEPGALASGVAITEQSDDGLPDGADLRKYDVDHAPIMSAGWFRVHRTWSDVDLVGETLFGLHDEPVYGLSQSFHEVRYGFDPARRTRTWDLFDERGRPQVVRDLWITTMRASMDERGHETLVEFLDGQGNRVVAKGLAAAIRSGFDGDHRVGVENVDPSGAPMVARSGGYARAERRVDAHDNVLEERYFDESGRLVPTGDGGAIVRSTYDERDLLLTRSHFDAQDRPMADRHGVWSEHRKYDRLRDLVQVAYFGTDGKATASDEGYAVKDMSYDDNGDLVTVSYLDAGGAPVLYEGEYATQRLKYDERGLPIEETYLDEHGEPALGKIGYAVAKVRRDRNGDAVERAFFGRRGEPIVRTGGYAAKRMKYDRRRRLVETALLDTSGRPVVGDQGWAVERTSYDERGLVVRVDHLDAAGAPRLDKEGRASLAKAYDARGNLVEETSLGADGKPAAAAHGWATRKLAYDERDELVEEALFAADGTPVMGDEGWSVRRARYDDFGDVTEEAFLDTAHDLVAPKDAASGASRSAMRRQRFDERHRLVETAYLEANGAPGKGPEGVAIVRYRRDAYGRATETSYLDGAGRPAASSDGKLVVRSVYDDAGRLVEERFVDDAGAPRAASDGCSGHRTRYDPQGRKVEEACLDAHDGVALSTDGWAVRRTLYDARGNPVDVSTYGPDGTLHADKDGVGRQTTCFDARNLVQRTSFFDAAGKEVHDDRPYAYTLAVDAASATFPAGLAARASMDEHGRLAPETIQALLRRELPAMQKCRDPGDASHAAPEGVVTTRFVIRQDGTVSEARDAGSTLKDAAVVACVASAIRGITFPKRAARGPVSVVYPVRFGP